MFIFIFGGSSFFQCRIRDHFSNYDFGCSRGAATEAAQLRLSCLVRGYSRTVHLSIYSAGRHLYGLYASLSQQYILHTKLVACVIWLPNNERVNKMATWLIPCSTSCTGFYIYSRFLKPLCNSHHLHRSTHKLIAACHKKCYTCLCTIFLIRTQWSHYTSLRK